MGKKEKIVNLLLRSLGAILITLVLYYVMLPPINVHSTSFWTFLLLVLALFAVALGAFNLSFLFNGRAPAKKGRQRKDQWTTESVKSTLLSGGLVTKIALAVLAVPIAVLILGNVFSSTVFNAQKYAGIITVSERDFKTDMPEIDQVTNIALMDSDSARILGNRKLGALANVVSQYVASDVYTQINYQGKPMKITNLEYDGFFKWLNNNENGIPGYIMVDTIANTAEYYETAKGMIYAESAYFSQDLMRALRFSYPTKIFDNISFEVDESGNIFYVVSCATARVGLFGAMDVNEVILFDPTNGSSQLYSVQEVPTWVDIVYDGYLACEKYDWQGTLSGGFFNSIIGNKGCKQTTDDFGYIMLNDDVWYFTGVTSVTSDASNIGFILSCARTGEYKFYPVIGAEEYSAMGAAEGEVQEKEYVASFPSLVNIAGEPSYIMVLKDANGLVKLYALVNVRQYNIVATGETQTAAINAYIGLLAQHGITEQPPAATELVQTATLASIRFLNLSGVSYAYLTDTQGNVYRMEFNAANEAVIFVKEGDSLKLSYTEDEKTGIRLVAKWETVTPTT